MGNFHLKLLTHNRSKSCYASLFIFWVFRYQNITVQLGQRSYLHINEVSNVE